MTELILSQEYVTIGYCDECFDPDWDDGWTGFTQFYGSEEEIREQFEDHLEEVHY